MEFEITHEGRFKYLAKGEGEPLLLLHGLFGALSNFQDVINYFSPRFHVVIPILPLYDLELNQTTVVGMVEYIEEFVKHRNYSKVNLIGNSLGGHIGLIFTLRNIENVSTLTLTGSSGLFESALGDTYPRKGDYEYVKRKTQETFYDPNTATTELIDEVYELVNSREKAIRIVMIAKSALRHNLREDLHKITTPVNLIWGKNDNITPSFVGEEFHKLLPDSELTLLNKCGHAAMMECPEEFNKCMDDFLKRRLTPSA